VFPFLSVTDPMMKSHHTQFFFCQRCQRFGNSNLVLPIIKCVAEQNKTAHLCSRQNNDLLSRVR